jgi:hypothetical protein
MREEAQNSALDCDCAGCQILEERQRKHDLLYGNLMAAIQANPNIPMRGSQLGLPGASAASPYWSGQTSMPMHTHSLNLNSNAYNGISPTWMIVDDLEETKPVVKPKPSIWKRIWDIFKI